jgi:hypothetical protein
VLRCDKAPAVAWLEQNAFITPRTISTADRRLFRQAANAAPALAQDVSDWAAGLNLWAEARKRDLLESIDHLAACGFEKLVPYFERLIGQLRPALRIYEAEPDALVAAFVEIRRENPRAVAHFVEIGREDRRDAELVTAGVVHMLAITTGAQQSERSAG